MNFLFRLLLALLATSATAQTQNTPLHSEAEIVGCWERVVFSDGVKKAMNEIEPWPARYQWFCFESDGTLKTYMSSEDSTLEPVLNFVFEA